MYCKGVIVGDIVPRDELVKQGWQGFAAVGGGVGLLILKAIAAIPVLGLVAAGVVTVVGLAVSTSKEDRKAGLITLGAGVMSLIGALSAFIPSLPSFGFLMILAGAGLIAGGALRLFRFWKNLRKRM